MLTVPATAPPPAVVANRKLAVLSVEFVIASENVAAIAEFTATPIAAVAGEVEDTIGAVVSVASVVAAAIFDWPETFPALSKASMV